MIEGYIFEVASLLIAAAALVFAALAFRDSRRTLQIAKESDLTALKLKALEGRAKAERSYLSLLTACNDMREQWEAYHNRQRTRPVLGAGFGLRDDRLDDTRHISNVENEGRKLLKPLAHDLSELGGMDDSALEEYIQLADQSALRIEQLAFRLSPPKRQFVSRVG